MRIEMLIVRGINVFFLQIDQRTNGFVVMFQKDNIYVDLSVPLMEDFDLWLTSGQCWSLADLGTLSRCPYQWRSLVFV